MANFTYTIPNAVTSRVVGAFVALYDYDNAKFPDETQAQFTERQVKLFIKRTVARHEAAEAAKTAARNAEANALTQIDVT